MTTIASATAAPRPYVRVQRERMFFMAMPVAMLFVVLVGFAPSSYLKGAFGTPPLRWLYHVHGLLFTGWMLLLIGQAALVTARRTDVHRRIGSGAAVLIAAMMLTAMAVSIDLGRRGAAPPGVPPLVFLVVPVATVVVFPLLTGAALWWRRRPDVHKRLMLIATLELIPAGFGRWPWVGSLGPVAFFGLTDLFLVAMIAYDLSVLRRVHTATIWGGVFLVASQVGRFVFAGTETWTAFATWLIA